MKNHFGIIEIGEICNLPDDGTENAKMAEVKFVHYPDCQQLIIWLTEYGHNYGQVRFIDRNTNKILRENPVTDHLSGSIQLLFDTLDLPPGEYTVEIDHPQGWKHSIALKKLKKGQEIKKPAPAEEIREEGSQKDEPIVYRDGFGNEIPNEDLILRDKLLKEMMRKFQARIEYEGTFRAGTITYIDGDTRIPFYHEMGGGNCMFYIDIPTEQEWEARTKTPLRSRQEILEFVAGTVNREQAPNCRYEIQGNSIVFYYK